MQQQQQSTQKGNSCSSSDDFELANISKILWFLGIKQPKRRHQHKWSEFQVTSVFSDNGSSDEDDDLSSSNEGWTNEELLVVKLKELTK